MQAAVSYLVLIRVRPNVNTTVWPNFGRCQLHLRLDRSKLPTFS